MAPTVTVRAPVRIDFGGGWTDVPPYCNEMGGFVCNAAISRYSTVKVTARTDGGVVIEGDGERDGSMIAASALRLGVDAVSVSLTSDFPVGAGLGGSSAAGVALVRALSAIRGMNLTHDAIAETSRAIETEELGIAGGRQDHYAAAFGGVLALRFSDRTNVERVPIPTAVAEELARRCIVIYTGQSRISGDTIKAVMAGYRDKASHVGKALERMRAIAEKMPAAISAGDVDGLGALIDEQWSHQRTLHPSIPTDLIDEIITRGKTAGAVGAKALGASGGGCVLVVAPTNGVERVRNAIAQLGELFDYSLDMRGVTVCE